MRKSLHGNCKTHLYNLIVGQLYIIDVVHTVTWHTQTYDNKARALESRQNSSAIL